MPLCHHLRNKIVLLCFLKHLSQLLFDLERSRGFREYYVRSDYIMPQVSKCEENREKGLANRGHSTAQRTCFMVDLVKTAAAAKALGSSSCSLLLAAELLAVRDGLAHSECSKSEPSLVGQAYLCRHEK